MRIILVLISFCLMAGQAYGEEFLEVKVADPYIELHTGAGRGYPVFHVVDRGDSVTILKRKTDWFKVRTAKGVEGWVHRNQLEQTLMPTGERTRFRDPTREDFHQRKWEVGLLSGDFDGAASMSLYGAYYFTPNLSGELVGTQAIGNFSSSLMVNARLMAHPFPDWRFSPFFGLGAGLIEIDPKTTLVQPTDRRDQIGNFTLGLNYYISRRFLFRIEYNNYVIFTSRNDNEEIEEWKAGLAVFF